MVLSGNSPQDPEERELEHRELLWLKTILESLPVGVLTLDRDWRITSFNRAASEITGYEPHEVIGWKCYDVFKSPVCQGDCPMEKALSCCFPVFDREVTFVNRNHRHITALVTASPLRDSQGRVIGGIETLRDITALQWMRRELAFTYDYSHIVGNSPAMQEVYARMEQVARTDTTVIILGESGTGKELVARAIHHRSERRDRPFIAVNCSALPESILESELFGHVKGAFTGAIRDKPGRFEMANGGTLFLDEVAELSPAVQVKLLRVLQEKEFQRVGDIRTIRVDIRLIAATNKDLRKEMEAGRFREDLYYRLHVFPIELPPLRSRLEDLPLLVNHFIEKFNHQMGRRIRGLSGEAMDALYRYPWPGNVRELENAIEHAFVHNRGVLIQLQDLPRHITEAPLKSQEQGQRTRRMAIESVEKELILRHLRECNWKRALAAKRLGISSVTLWRKMKRYGIEPFQP